MAVDTVVYHAEHMQNTFIATNIVANKRCFWLLQSCLLLDYSIYMVGLLLYQILRKANNRLFLAQCEINYGDNFSVEHLSRYVKKPAVKLALSS